MKANQKSRGIIEDNDAMIFELLIGAVFALIIGYTALNIGVYITGTVGSSLVSSYPASALRTRTQNLSIGILNNLTTDLGSNSKMVSTAYMITIITLPLIAVVMIKQML
jgi:hypothetical protein